MTNNGSRKIYQMGMQIKYYVANWITIYSTCLALTTFFAMPDPEDTELWTCSAFTWKKEYLIRQLVDTGMPKTKSNKHMSSSGTWGNLVSLERLKGHTHRLHGPSFMFDFRIVVKDEVLHGAVGTKGWDFFSTPGIWSVGDEFATSFRV
jgi:hypothetical protein